MMMPARCGDASVGVSCTDVDAPAIENTLGLVHGEMPSERCARVLHVYLPGPVCGTVNIAAADVVW